MKNKKIIKLTESDLIRIVKKVLSEAKVDFTSCFTNYPEWLKPNSTEISMAAEQGGQIYKKKNTIIRQIRGGVVYPMGTCEVLKNGKIGAGILSNITNNMIKEKAVTKTAQFCMKHLDEVAKDLKSKDPNKIKYHIKDDFNFGGKTKEQWIEEYSFDNDIANMQKISKCLYATNF